MLDFVIFESLPEASSGRFVSTEPPLLGGCVNVYKIRKSHERPSRLDETLDFVIGHFASTKCSLLPISTDKNSKSWHFAKEGGQSAQRIKFDYFSEFPGVVILLEREGGFGRLAWKGSKNMAPPGGYQVSADDHFPAEGGQNLEKRWVDNPRCDKRIFPRFTG